MTNKKLPQFLPEKSPRTVISPLELAAEIEKDMAYQARIGLEAGITLNAEKCLVAIAALRSARPEALRSERECQACGAYEGDHLYCKTCGSCGEDGCCPPEMCQRARRNEIIEEVAGQTCLTQLKNGDYAWCITDERIRALKTTPSPQLRSQEKP